MPLFGITAANLVLKINVVGQSAASLLEAFCHVTQYLQEKLKKF